MLSYTLQPNESHAAYHDSLPGECLPTRQLGKPVASLHQNNIIATKEII